MSERSYWLDLFTGATWDEFNAAGARVSGFRETRWKTVRQIRPGDYLLCYLTGVSRFIGVLEVAGEPYRDSTRIWKSEEFPCRLPVRIVHALTPGTAVPVADLRDRLSMFRNMTSPSAWTARFRGSPSRWSATDAEVVVEAVADAAVNPVERPFDRRKLDYRPKTQAVRIETVTIPESDQAALDVEEGKETRAHAEMQWLLLKLGNDMGLDVWVARNDRGREVGGHRFAELPGLKSELPLQFDDVTNKTIELIDVLWLEGNTIVAAFEIESTTSIYSGILRLSDLIAMQPNLNIPLFLVAPEERRERVISEVNRPTFSRLKPPMSEMCRFISFTALRDRLRQVGEYVGDLKPSFLRNLSESCRIEQ